MNAVEFTTELSDSATLTIPRDAAAMLPRSGTARVIVLTDEAEDGVEEAWDAEIARRVESIHDGTATGRPADEVFADIRARFGK